MVIGVDFSSTRHRHHRNNVDQGWLCYYCSTERGNILHLHTHFIVVDVWRDLFGRSFLERRIYMFQNTIEKNTKHLATTTRKTKTPTN
jgi:hypothetical protein